MNFDPIYIVVAIICIIISLAVHEFMHAFVGYKLGDDTAAVGGRLTLNPLSHIDPIMTVALPIITLLLFQAPILAAKPVPFNPARVKYEEFGAALIAFAGPASNLVLAFAAALAANSLPAGGFLADFLQVFIVLNVALFVFNLIPIPPLDGSRVLYAFAPEPVQNLLEQIEPYGFFIIIALVLAGGFTFLGNLNQLVLNFLP
jgi:Zn-dependent protease